MTAINISCNYLDCGAEAGKPCTGVLYSGRRVDLMIFHACRIDEAAAMSRSADTPTVEQFDKAVEDLI